MEERFLLDANTFITPFKNYYPFDLTPGFWTQLALKLQRDSVYILDVVKNEVMKGEDELSEWFELIDNVKIVDRRNTIIINKYKEVLEFLQESPLYSERALRNWSNISVADPWLIAAASALGYTLVTFETSAGIISINSPSGKPKIPDIAKAFNVNCVNLFYFMRKMNIAWLGQLYSYIKNFIQIFLYNFYKRSIILEIIKLIEPIIEYKKDIWQFWQEIIGSNEKDKFVGCENLEEYLPAKEQIETIKLHKKEENYPKDIILVERYTAIHGKDNKIVGIVDLCYHINTSILSIWGWHIGYYVRLDGRRKE